MSNESINNEINVGALSEAINEKLDKNLSNLDAAGQAKFDAKASTSLNNLSSAGQAILDRKVEVEALLAQNGYAKFTWKENNKVAKLIINFCTRNSSAIGTVTFAHAYNTVPAVFRQNNGKGTNNIVLSAISVYNVTTSSLYLETNSSIPIQYIFAVGY